MQHPVAAALIAYARFSVDFDHQVERHIFACKVCARLVHDLKLQRVETEEERRILRSLARVREALLAAAAVWGKAS